MTCRAGLEMEKHGENRVANAETSLIRHRGPSVVDDGLPLLTDVVDGGAMQFSEGCVGKDQPAHSAIDTTLTAPCPPTQGYPGANSPEIRDLVANEVLRQLGELLPQIADRAGAIAQGAVENYLQGLRREMDGASRMSSGENDMPESPAPPV